MKKLIVIIIIITLLILICGIAYWQYYSEGYLNRWTVMNSPSGTQKILSINKEGYLILSIDGVSYYYSNPDWEKYNLEHEALYRYSAFCREEKVEYKVNPSFNTIDEVARWCGGPEWSTYEIMTISQRNEVWSWHQFFSSFPDIRGLASLCIAMVIAEILFITMVVFVYRKKAMR